MTDDSPTPDVPSLVAALADEDPARRAEAARVLTKLGPEGADALDALLGALEDPIFLVRAMAAAAVGRQGEAAAEARPEGVVPALTRLLEDPLPPVRFWAVDALGRMGASASSVLERIERLVEDDDQAVRGAATRAVKRVRAAPSEGS